MTAKELNTEAELLTVDRPCRCPIGSCKCCCYQSAKIMSGGNDLGEVKETCWWCVPQFNIYDDQQKQIYILHQPTCCCGTCVYCCAEGNPCSRGGCCKGKRKSLNALAVRNVSFQRLTPAILFWKFSLVPSLFSWSKGRNRKGCRVFGYVSYFICICPWCCSILSLHLRLVSHGTESCFQY